VAIAIIRDFRAACANQKVRVGAGIGLPRSPTWALAAPRRLGVAAKILTFAKMF